MKQSIILKGINTWVAKSWKASILFRVIHCEALLNAMPFLHWFKYFSNRVDKIDQFHKGQKGLVQCFEQLKFYSF